MEITLDVSVLLSAIAVLSGAIGTLFWLVIKGYEKRLLDYRERIERQEKRHDKQIVNYEEQIKYKNTIIEELEKEIKSLYDLIMKKN